eukprot:6193235-Pleurochrysis_carterae.AAC.2
MLAAEDEQFVQHYTAPSAHGRATGHICIAGFCRQHSYEEGAAPVDEEGHAEDDGSAGASA